MVECCGWLTGNCYMFAKVCGVCVHIYMWFLGQYGGCSGVLDSCQVVA